MKQTIKSNRGLKAGLTRRSFLSHASIGATGAVLLPNAMGSVTFGPSGSYSDDTLITIFLRGAQDGLSLVIPWGDLEYQSVRSTPANLVVTPTQFFDSGQFYGVNPAAADLLTPWAQGQLAIVNQVGLTVNGTRSHFDAMARMETGAPGPNPLQSGWLGRVLTENTGSQTGLRGVSLSSLLPRMLGGAPSTLPISNPANFAFPAPAQTVDLRKLKLTEAYAASPHQIVGSAGLTTLQAIDDVSAANTGSYTGSVTYPTSGLGDSLRSIAALLTAGTLNLESAHVDVGGWDHHSNLGPVSGTFSNMVGDLAASLKAFFEDMGNTTVKYTLVVQTEFGRRIFPNASGGVDHGKGGLMLVMGPGVNGGGEVIDAGWKQSVNANPAQSPLLPANWDEGDLPVEIDYREILGEICMDRLGLTQGQVEDEVFPGFSMPMVDWNVTLP